MEVFFYFYFSLFLRFFLWCLLYLGRYQGTRRMKGFKSYRARINALAGLTPFFLVPGFDLLPTLPYVIFLFLSILIQFLYPFPGFCFCRIRPCKLHTVPKYIPSCHIIPYFISVSFLTYKGTIKRKTTNPNPHPPLFFLVGGGEGSNE